MKTELEVQEPKKAKAEACERQKSQDWSIREPSPRSQENSPDIGIFRSMTADSKRSVSTMGKFKSRISEVSIPRSLARKRTDSFVERPQYLFNALTRKDFKDLMMEPTGPNRFVPHSSIEKLMRKENVEATLRIEGSGWRVDVKHLITFVCNEANVLFAILVYMERIRDIEHFYEIKFTDRMLPVTCDFDDRNASEISPIIEKAFDEKIWTARELEYFCIYDQWSFLSPVFEEETFHYQFNDKYHMPFVGSAIVTKETNFSTVEKRRVHRDHLRVGSRIVSFLAHYVDSYS